MTNPYHCDRELPSARSRREDALPAIDKEDVQIAIVVVVEERTSPRVGAENVIFLGCSRYDSETDAALWLTLTNLGDSADCGISEGIQPLPAARRVESSGIKRR